MADEIVLTIGLRVTKSELKFVREQANLYYDLTGDKYISNVAEISESAHELLETGDLATAGVAVFKNLDATNYVEVGLDVSSTFYPLIRLDPGEEFPLKLATLAVYAKADTAAVDLQYTIFER